MEEQYIQDREVFNFLVNGLAVLECFGYAAYFLGSFIKPEAFGLVLPDKRRHIDLAKTSNAYEAHFSEEAIAKEIKAVLKDAAYLNWKEIRNIIAHQSHPGRNIYLSTTPEGDRPHDWKVPGLPALDVNLTASRLVWLGDTLGCCLVAMEGFVMRHL